MRRDRAYKQQRLKRQGGDAEMVRVDLGDGGCTFCGGAFGFMTAATRSGPGFIRCATCGERQPDDDTSLTE